MKSKLFLTSLTAIAIAMPAMAEDFPGDGYMKENKTYTNAATSTNMDDVYEGSVNAIAEYENIPYTVNAGQYLPQSSTTVTTCTAGSFCPGLPSAVNYSTTTDQGITSCATLENGAYPSSVAGATANTQCYRACSGNVTIAHASGVTGNDYYGAGVDTCEPTGCENGWTLKPGAPDLTTLIGVTEAGIGTATNNSSGTQVGSGGGMTSSSAGISGNSMAFAVDYGAGKGVIKGHGRCSTRPAAEDPWDEGTYNVISGNFVDTLTDETGQTGAQYCYCQLDSYTPVSGGAQSLSAPWVFIDVGGYGVADFCADLCADECASYLRSDSARELAFRAAVFGSLGSSLASCEANQITINWHDVDPTYAGQNNEGTATYGGDIRTPFKALDKTNEGKSFKGWRFEKPTPSQGD